MKRVVNGWNENGEPAILYEGPPPKHFDFGVATSDEIWVTNAVPAAWEGVTDPTVGDFRVEPPLGGSICRVATYKPGAAIEIHSTKTVDYVIVVSGELTLILEGRDIQLTPGDVVVSLAAPHGWANRGSTDCVAVAILLTADGATEEDLIKWP